MNARNLTLLLRLADMVEVAQRSGALTAADREFAFAEAARLMAPEAPEAPRAA